MSDILADLDEDYCRCLPDYKLRGRVDPQCESCNTIDTRREAGNEIRRLRARLAEAERLLRRAYGSAPAAVQHNIAVFLNGAAVNEGEHRD